MFHQWAQTLQCNLCLLLLLLLHQLLGAVQGVWGLQTRAHAAQQWEVSAQAAHTPAPLLHAPRPALLRLERPAVHLWGACCQLVQTWECGTVLLPGLQQQQPGGSQQLR